jgi:hypothetical protein
MKNTDPLFELIKSLEPNEKRYFKLHVFAPKQGKNNDYLALFDAIDKQKEWDEKKLKVLFGSGKNYSALKRYLYDTILKSLRQYWAEKTENIQILQMISSVEILMKKGLVQQAQKIIDRLKEKIKFSGSFLELYILHLDFLNISHGSQLESFQKRLHIFPNFFNRLHQMEESLKLSEAQIEMIIHSYQSGFARNEAEEKVISQIIHRIENLDISEKSSLNVRLRKEDALGIAYGMINNRLASVAAKQRSINLRESSPNIIKINPRAYINSLYNLGSELVRIKAWEQCFELIKKFEILLGTLKFSKNPKVQENAFFKFTGLSLYFFIMSGGFERACKRIPQYLKTMEEEKIQLRPVYAIALSYQFAYSFFGACQWESSLDWIEKILEKSNSNIHNNQQTAARILKLLNHYELQNWRLFPSLVRSFYRYLAKSIKSMKVELLFLDMIRQLARTNQTEKEIFESFLPKFKTLQNDPIEGRFFEFCDFTSWLESKLESRSFAEIIREKSLNQYN